MTVSVSRRGQRCRLRVMSASALLAFGMALGVGARAQAPTKPSADAAMAGTAWSALTPAQQSALAPLKDDWHSIDAIRRQKWLEIAARLSALPPEERQRIQQRMSDWARMTPDERGRVRLQFQELRQISPTQRQARWDAYLALPVEERRALAESARTVPKATVRNKDVSAAGGTGASRAAAQPAAKVVAPTVVQAKPGASTTLISKTAAPPATAPASRPKADNGKGALDRRTLLPKPETRAEAASAPQ